MIRYLYISLLLLCSSGLFAQKQDSVKQPRIIKEYNLSSDYTEELTIPFDTVFSLFHRYRLTDRYSIFNATLGNYGLPFYQMNFFDRISDPDQFLYSSYYPYMHLPGNAIFMDTQTPFTELSWTFAGPKELSEQTFRVRHTQNVNRFFNFGFVYDIVFSLGRYNYQRAEDKTFTLFSSYRGPNYKMYVSAGLNNITSHENGGITSKANLEQSNTRDIPVNLGGLDNASSFLKNRNILLVQRYTIGGKAVKPDSLSKKKPGLSGLDGTFSHIFIAEGIRRTYTDSDPLSGFYDTVLINKTKTFDSLFSRSIKNTIRFDFTTDETRKFRLGGGVGIRNEMFRFSQIMPTHDTTFADTISWTRSNNVLIGKLFNSIGEKFGWTATGEMYLTGYRIGDFNLNGVITKSFDLKKGRASWVITGGMMNRQPSIWFDRWGSNNFEWHNNLNKEFRTTVGTELSYPGRDADLSFKYAIIKNYPYFDSLAVPAQFSSGLSVAAITIRKGLKAWKFHLDTDVLIQKSSNSDILDLPLATVRSAAYFDHLFKFKTTNGRLNFQIGADATYNTLYHPYNYMPATGRFFNQSTVKTGNYPFVNAFVNLRIKRTRIFMMFDHVNSGMMGTSLANNYDMIPNYMMNLRMFRYGIAWTFYD